MHCRGGLSHQSRWFADALRCVQIVFFEMLVITYFIVGSFIHSVFSEYKILQILPVCA